MLGIFLPLITTNCAVLGVALLNVQEKSASPIRCVRLRRSGRFLDGVVLFAATRERVAVADVPVAFRGLAIALVTAGLMSLAFMGFAGLIKG